MKNSVQVDDIKIMKSKVQNPAGIDKYVSRGKKRGHARKSSKMSNSQSFTGDMNKSQDHATPTKKPKIRSKKIKKQINFDNYELENSVKKAKHKSPHNYE